MEQEEKDIELIEAYHQGRLDDVDIAAFERRRAEDAGFDQKAEDYLHIMKEVRSFGEQDFMQKLKSWEKDIAGEKKAKVIPLRKILSIAAILVLLMVPIGYLLLHDAFKADHQQLFTAYFEPYDDVISERSEQASLLDKGFSAYNQENYMAAVAYFEGYIDKNPADQGIKTYLGISYLAAGESGKAEGILKEISQNATGIFKEVSDWYLVLAFLKSDKKENMHSQLLLISSQENHMFKKQADELIEEFE